LLTLTYPTIAKNTLARSHTGYSMSFAIITLLYLFSFDVYYFLLKFHVLIASPLKYIRYIYSKADASFGLVMIMNAVNGISAAMYGATDQK
jgi:hypothetical protein